MKKSIIYSVFLLTVIYFSGCKSEPKAVSTKEIVNEIPKSSAKFSLKEAKNDIRWTAYKTTEKIPVNGQFKKVNITANGDGSTIKEAIHNTSFSIPVSSIFTKDSSRDYKIRKFFFSFMDTSLLSGTLEISTATTGVATIRMNGITDKVPFSYTINDNVFSMKSTLDINKWNVKAAIASLNKVCEELHKGADGISKTWDEVSLNITSTF
ncbi:YceI family protein [Polaribacter sp.]|nr:YceI family protein [Polaribacter sp.]